MNIPNDKGGTWRLDKFVEYQHFSPAIDPLTYTKYAQDKKLTPDDCIVLGWYHSMTYCEITAIMMYEELGWSNLKPSQAKQFWVENKPDLIFGSARRYAKNMDWFYPLLAQFMKYTEGQPYEWLNLLVGQNEPAVAYKMVERELSKWKYMGRFSIDLFLEALISMGKAKLIPVDISLEKWDWKNCSNLVSGLFNIFYLDDLADLYDKTGKIGVPEPELDVLIQIVLNRVKDTYPDQPYDKVSVVNKICSWRNLFKGARYGGFHHDRQLGNIRAYEKAFPEKQALWDNMYDIRRQLFPERMLGEIGGWDGIRKERKKLWLEKGLTGVEIIS